MYKTIKDKVNSIISRVGKTKDITSILDKKINTLKSQSVNNYEKQAAYIKLMNSINQKGNESNYNNNGEIKSTDELLNDICSDLNTAQADRNRIKYYDNIKYLRKRIPILQRAIRIYVDNILSPDDITKSSLIYTSYNKTESVEHEELISKYTDIVQYTNLESNIDDILTNTLLEGDRFIEIVVNSEHFLHTINNSDIKPLYESRANFNEGDFKLASDFITIETVNNLKEIAKDIKSGKAKRMFTEEELPDEEEADEAISLNDLSIQIHNPRNVIVLHSNKMILGYLILSGRDLGNVGSKNSNYFDSMKTVINVSKDKKYKDEEEYSSYMIDLFYDYIKTYLTNIKNVEEIPNDLKLIITNIVKNREGINNLKVRYIPETNMQHFKIPDDDTFPYGASYLDNLLFILKLYLSRMISTVIYKIARTGKQLAVYVNVDNSRDMTKKINAVKRGLTKREVTSDAFDDIEVIPSIISTMENIYIPVQDGKRTIEIEPLEVGSFADRDDDDKSILRDILTGIDIPPTFLGVEEFNSTKATVSQEVPIFARSIVRLQKLFTGQFTELVKKIYIIVTPEDQIKDEYKNIIVTFMPPRGLMSEMMSGLYTQINTIVDNLKNIQIPEKSLERLKRQWLPEINWEEAAISEIEDEHKNKKGPDDGEEMNFDMGGM